MTDTMQEPKTLEEVLKTIIDNYIERTADLVVEDGKNFGNKHFLKIDMQVSIEQLIKEEQERTVKQARADQLKKLWNATQHDIVPEGTPPRDMSEELHKMIKELEV